MRVSHAVSSLLKMEQIDRQTECMSFSQAYADYCRSLLESEGIATQRMADIDCVEKWEELSS